MSTPTDDAPKAVLYRATVHGVNTRDGGLLESGEDYEITGTPTVEEANEIRERRLVKVPPKPPEPTAAEIRAVLLALDPPVDPPKNAKKAELIALLPDTNEEG